MNQEEHKKRHEELHKALDELVADMIGQTTMLPSTTSVMDLMKWSNEQQKNPTNEKRFHVST
jgi:hypothetical protein